MRHVLVTGAGGMSGAAAVRELLGRGWRVTAVLRASPRRQADVFPTAGALRVVHADLANSPELPDSLDAVVHAAASSPAPGVRADDMVRDNVVATRQLVAHARKAGARSFIHFSSLSVYGRVGVSVVDETTPRIEPNLYGATKHVAECLIAEGSEDFRSLSLRLPGILGPGATRNWLSRVFASARRGEAITIFNPDAPFNNAVHTTDVARFVADSVSRQTWSGHHPLTLGADGFVTIREAVEIIVMATGGRSSIIIGGNPGGSFTVSNVRAVERFGYRPMPIRALLSLFAGQQGGV